MRPCCQSRVEADLPKRTLIRTLLQPLAGGVIPGALLCLMPKCPLCLVAWSGIATGLTLPFSLANGLYNAIILLCVGSVFLSVIVFAHSLVVTRSLKIGNTRVENDLR